MRRDGGEVGPPRVDLALADARLGAVVDDDAQRRMALDDAREPRQVARQHERVEHEVVRDHRVERRRVRRAREPLVVADVLHHRPQRRRACGSRASAAICSGASLASKSTQPTTPRDERRAVREVEQPARLGERRRGLDEDRALDAVAREDRREVGGAEVAVDRRRAPA